MFVVVDELEPVHPDLVQGIEEGIDGPIPVAGNVHFRAVGLDVPFKDGAGVLIPFVVVVHLVGPQFILAPVVHILFVEQFHDLAGGQFVPVFIGGFLHHMAEFRMHFLGQVIPHRLLHHKGSAALAGLAVDPDHRFIFPVDIRRVDGQIGHFPIAAVGVGHVLEALPDGILVGPGESGEDQFPGVRMAGFHLHLGDAFADPFDPVDVGEIQLGIDVVGVHIEGQGDDVHIPGPFPVAEQGPFHPVGSGHQGQFRGGHPFTPVIVGVQADDGPVPVLQIPDEVFDLVRIGVGGGHFHRGRQVDDHRFFLGGSQGVQHRFTDFHRIVGFRAGEAFGRIFVPDVHAAFGDFFFRQFPDQFGPVHGNLGDPFHVLPEHDFPLEGGSGIVEVDDHVLGTLHRFKGLLDQFRTGLNQHLDGHVIGDVVVLNQGPEDFIFRFRSGGESHFDFLEADFHQGGEQQQLFFQLHGGHQGLVPVPQVYAAPDGGLGNGLVRPGTVRQTDSLEGNVLFNGLMHHEFLLVFARRV